MPHLRKSSTTGHLLKNTAGHLITDCAQDVCNLLVSESGGIEGYDQTFDAGGGGYTLVLTFNTYFIVDRLAIYVDGSLVLDTGYISGTYTYRVDIPAGSEAVRIVIYGSEEGTSWVISSYCEWPSSSSSSSEVSSSSSGIPTECGYIAELFEPDWTGGTFLPVPYNYVTGTEFVLTIIYSGPLRRVRLRTGLYGDTVVDYGCTTYVYDVITLPIEMLSVVLAAFSSKQYCGITTRGDTYMFMGYNCVS